jgi:hypothetical protein
MVLDGSESEFFAAVYLVRDTSSQCFDGLLRRGGMGYAAGKVRAISGKSFC